LIKNFLDYLKIESSNILFRFTVGFVFMELSALLIIIFFRIEGAAPDWFIVFSEYFWIEAILGFFLLIFLIFGGFLYAYSGYSKNKISLILSDALLTLFIFLFVISVFIGWKNNFYLKTYIIFFNNYYIFTKDTFFLKVWIIFFSMITLIISKNFLSSAKHNLVEYPLLIGLVSFLLMLLVSLVDLFALFVVIESLFFLLMCLSALKFSNITVEACMKYFIQNVFVSGLALFGILIIYFICKSTNIFIIKGVILYLTSEDINNNAHIHLFLVLGVLLLFLTFLFKIGLFPVHFYVADLYEASPYSVIFFFSSVVKPIFLLFFLKLFELFVYNSQYFSIFLFFVSFFSVSLGLLGALQQVNIKRFLGYTSINQLGFLLFCFICNFNNWSSIFIYLFLYALFQIPFFLVMSNIVDSKFVTLINFSDFNKLVSFSNFKYVISFSFFFISGLPPFLLILLVKALSSGYFLVVIFMILMNVLSLTYYLRIIKTILFEEKNNFSFTKFRYIDVKLSKRAQLGIIADFILCLLFIIFFSIVLLLYFNEIEFFISQNSTNFLFAKFA
jgi:NADH-quinone oxidoreductase subunit N